MKQLLLAIALIGTFVSPVSAQTRAPFGTSLDFTVRAIGILSTGTYQWYAGAEYDKSESNDRSSKDTMTFSSQFNRPITNIAGDSMTCVGRDTTPDFRGYFTEFDSAFVAWDTTTHTITKFHFESRRTPSANMASMESEGWGIELGNMLYDSTKIHFEDSVLSHHLVSFGYRKNSDAHDQGNRERTQEFENFGAVSSLDLSGVFSPTHLANPAAVSSVVADPMFSLHADFSELECNFTPSSSPRTLGLYSLLGSKCQSFEIAPSHMRLTFPRPQAGFYIVTLDTSVMKIFLPE